MLYKLVLTLKPRVWLISPGIVTGSLNYSYYPYKISYIRVSSDIPLQSLKISSSVCQRWFRVRIEIAGQIVKFRALESHIFLRPSLLQSSKLFSLKRANRAAVRGSVMLHQIHYSKAPRGQKSGKNIPLAPAQAGRKYLYAGEDWPIRGQYRGQIDQWEADTLTTLSALVWN